MLSCDMQASFAPRQLLHAAQMRVTHPRTGLPLVLRAPLPEDFEQALGRVGIEKPQALPDLPECKKL